LAGPPSLDITYLLRAILPGVGPLVAPFGRSFSASAAHAGRARARAKIEHMRNITLEMSRLDTGFYIFPLSVP